MTSNGGRWRSRIGPSRRGAGQASVSGPSLFANRLCAALPLLITAFTVLFGLRRLDDYDTWWHLASGRWIAQHGTVPTTDTLSFTVPDHPWINLQWAYDLALYGLFRVGGADLLVAVTALLFGLAIALLFVNLRPHLDPLASSLLAIWIVFIASERFMVRPEVVSLVLLQALLWVLESARRDRGRRLWLLIPLMVLWVNTHALFVIGLFIIGCHVIGAMTPSIPLRPARWLPASASDALVRKRLVLAGAGSVLATLLNPYHVHGVFFPIKLLSRINGSDEVYRSIGEFAPPFSAAPALFSGMAYRIFLVFAVATILLAGARAVFAAVREGRAAAGRNRVRDRGPVGRGTADRPDHGGSSERDGRGFDLSGLMVFVGLAFVSLLARRNMALFAMGVAPFLAASLRTLKPGSPSWSGRTARLASASAAAALALGLVGAGWFIVGNGFYRWSGQDHEFGLGVLEVNFPIQAAAFVREMKLPGRLFCDLTSGGYLTWDAPIGDKVYIDGRLEVYDTAFLSAYLRAMEKPEVWQSQADQAGIGTVLIFHRWPNHHVLIDFLNRDARWALVYVDETAAVFVRSAGNERLIELARQQFASGFGAHAEDLLRHTPSGWRWPSAQVIALASYADALILTGMPDPATELYSGLLGFHLPPETEVAVRLSLARLYAFKGATALAREQLDKAAAADPANEQIRAMRAQLRP